MAGCNSCGGQKSHVQFQVKLPNGSVQNYPTVALAQQNCKGCPIKAVPKP